MGPEIEYIPTETEIQAQCVLIQMTWSLEERARRWVAQDGEKSEVQSFTLDRSVRHELGWRRVTA